MKFDDALAELKAGFNLARECWNKEDGYLTFMPGMKHVWKILLNPNPNAGNHLFSVEEMEAEDWAIYDESKFNPKCEEITEVLEEIAEPELSECAA